MGLSFTRIVLPLSLVLTPLLGDEAKIMHSLYLMHSNEIEAAIKKYQEAAQQEGPNFEVLRQLFFLLMKQGIKKKDPETKLLSVYGAGLAMNASSLEILEEGLLSEEQQLQTVSLFFIMQLNDDRSDSLVQLAMASPFLGTRVEACYHMAMKKHPHASAYTEGLMQRLPPPFKAFFPQLFALIGSNEALAQLNQLLEDPLPQVRVEAIRSLAQFQRDDFIPLIRKHLTHANVAEKEASAFALGYLQDTSSSNVLKKISTSGSESLKLAALKALYLLGDVSVKKEIEKMAEEQNFFAISTLGDIPGGEETLVSLLPSPNLHTRINAAVALLKRRDKRCLRALKDVFITDTRDLALQPVSSLGRTHQAIKVVSSSKQQNEKLFDPDLSLALREQFLALAFHLGEEEFLKLAKMLLDLKQYDLVPQLMRLLENLQTENTIALLKEETQKIGSPLIRDYANLVLFKLKVEGPYEENLIQWIKGQKNTNLIKLRPMLSIQTRKEISDYTLSGEDSSRLLLDSYAALASRQDAKSIDILLTALRDGNEKNRYALAGLLMRATE
ncbi:MAG TPA: hypothetical protein VLG44_08620 [Chlamydiales bacterium]|nr:hypothetical protein [Chlamydiales bacterium]